MWIQNFSISDFRNIIKADIPFSPRWNVFFGRNAQGKTNILEAIYFLATLRSFRTKNIQEIPRFGVESFLLKAMIKTHTLPLSVKAMYDSGKKSITLNDEPLTTMGKVIGFFPVVLATNKNIDLVGQSPSFLRRFLDTQLSQSIPEYLKTLMQYEKVLRFRNVLLRSYSVSERKQLGVWTKKLVQLGTDIYRFRVKAVKRLGIFARLNLKRITEEKEELEVRYISQIEGDELESKYMEKLQESSKKEKERGFTLIGPHRDNLLFMLDGKPAHKYASTGQKKSIGLALKLAETENIKSFCQNDPAVFLDEIFNELDEFRRNNLYALIPRKSQVFCTTAEKNILREIESKGDAFRVAKGKVFRP